MKSTCILALCVAQLLTSRGSLEIAFISQLRHIPTDTRHIQQSIRFFHDIHSVGGSLLSGQLPERRRPNIRVQSAKGSENATKSMKSSAATKIKNKSKRVGKKKNPKSTKATDKTTTEVSSSRSNNLLDLNDGAPLIPALKGSEASYKERLARAAENLLTQRKEEEAIKFTSKRLSFSSISAAKTARVKRRNSSLWISSTNAEKIGQDKSPSSSSNNALAIMGKLKQKILADNYNHAGQKLHPYETNLHDSPQTHTYTQHATDSMQSLLGYNQFGGEWSDRNTTTYHVAIVFGKALICDQVTVEYATRIRTLVKLLQDEPTFCPKLICFTGGVSVDQGNSISDASAGYVYFRHLCAAQNVTIDPLTTRIWVDVKSSNEREAMERIASELWRNHIKQWLSERPLVERTNQHYGVGWKILERKVDIHFTLVSTEYHLCNLNDVHHRSPVKSFLQPLVSLRGLAGSDRWENNQELEVMDPNYSTSVHVKGNKVPVVAERTTFGGIENSVDTSWSFQYGTYPFLHGDDEATVFLGQCFLLGEELTPLLVNMKGVVEQVSFYNSNMYQCMYL